MATERLAAFTEAYLAFLDSQLDLVLISETSTPGVRQRTGAHAFWRQHCRLLLQAAGAPDPTLRAEILLAALSAEQVGHWLREQNLPLTELTASLSRLAGTLASAG